MSADHDTPAPRPVASAAQLGLTVEQLRRAQGLTQGELADLAGVPRRFVNELEGGHATLFARRLFDVLRALDAQAWVTDPAAASAPETRRDATTDAAPSLRDLGW